MSGKEVKFAKPKRQDVPATSPDQWVKDRAQSEGAGEPMKRLTIDIPASLHTRVKAGCATRGVKMADMLRAYLEREFPET